MHTLLNEHFFSRKDSCLGVQRIKDRLNENNVGATIDQTTDLVGIGNAQIIKCDGTITGIVDIRRQRSGTVCWAKCAGNKTATTIFLLRADGCATSQARAITVELINGIFHAVIRLRNRRRRECVGFENVSSGHSIGIMNFFNCLWLGERQKVVVALKLAIAGTETLTAKMLFVKAQALNLRPHSTVKNQNPFTCGFGECCEHFRTVWLNCR